MGQYYKPVSIEKKEHVFSHDYNKGLKLMEHSYIGNNFVAAVESLLVKGGRWHGDHIVWGGDYADPEPETIDAEHENGRNLYDICETKIKPVIKSHITGTYRKKLNFLKNLDTNEFIDLRKVPPTDEGDWEDEKGKKRHYIMRIHPLPLLTCEGNGRGGGDYHKENPLVGLWTRNRVVMQKERPRNCKEIVFDVVE